MKTEEAEQNLPVRPLVGTTLVAEATEQASSVASSDETAAEPAKADKPDAFERLLNGLFGGT